MTESACTRDAVITAVIPPSQRAYKKRRKRLDARIPQEFRTQNVRLEVAKNE